MKHDFKLQENDRPRWHSFVCSKCGKDLRISKWEMGRLLKGDWIYVRDFLPTCVKSYTRKGNTNGNVYQGPQRSTMWSL